MKILFINQNIEKGLHGGDIVQMENTKLFLEKNFSAEVILCTSIADESLFADADLVHVFNLQTADYTLKAIRTAHKYNKKVLLSTIFWDLSHMAHVNTAFKLFGITPNEFLQNIKPIGDYFNRFLYSLFPSKENVMFSKRPVAKEILQETDFLLPNSEEELNSLIQIYGLPKNETLSKSFVVPNAVDYKRIISCNRSCSFKTTNLKDYILQVGAIAPVKNQLNVIKAFFDSPKVPIVFIGRVWDEKYNKKLIALAEKRGNVYIFNEMPQREIFPFYINAACHILPSFRESPGLSSLEALCSGCPIVVASEEYCPVDYYGLRKIAYLCNPYSAKSIRNAVTDAIKNKRPNLDEEYFHNYSYERAAEITYSAYLKVLYN